MVQIGSRYNGDFGRQTVSARRLPPGPPLHVKADWRVEAKAVAWTALRTVLWVAIVAVLLSMVRA